MEPYIAGALGGFLVEFLLWYRYQMRPLPKRMRRSRYWITVAIRVVLSGVIPGFVYKTTSTIVAFHIGATLPVIAKQLEGSLPEEIQKNLK